MCGNKAQVWYGLMKKERTGQCVHALGMKSGIQRKKQNWPQRGVWFGSLKSAEEIA